MQQFGALCAKHWVRGSCHSWPAFSEFICGTVSHSDTWVSVAWSGQAWVHWSCCRWQSDFPTVTDILRSWWTRWVAIRGHCTDTTDRRDSWTCCWWPRLAVGTRLLPLWPLHCGELQSRMRTWHRIFRSLRRN